MPPFATVVKTPSVCIAVVAMPYPIGILPMSDGSTVPEAGSLPNCSPGKPIAVRAPNPSSRMVRSNRGRPTASAISIVPTFEDCARISRTVQSAVPWASSSGNRCPPTVMDAGTEKRVLRSITPDSSALAIVATFAVEPGSKVSVTSRFRFSSPAGCAGTEPWGPSTFAIASTSPVCTSTIAAIPASACTFCTSAVSCCSTRYCSDSSRVSTRSLPRLEGTSRRSDAEISRPLGSRSSASEPAVPLSASSYCFSIPPSPWLNNPANPITGPASDRAGAIRFESATWPMPRSPNAATFSATLGDTWWARYTNLTPLGLVMSAMSAVAEIPSTGASALAVWSRARFDRSCEGSA